MKPGRDYVGVGVGAMVFDEQGRVFLARRGSRASNERGTWEFPGGKVAFGEKLGEAVTREFVEEYGMAIEITELLGVNDHILVDEGEHWVSPTFLARHLHGEPQIMEPEKCSACGWFSLDDLPQPLSLVTQDDLAMYRAKILKDKDHKAEHETTAQSTAQQQTRESAEQTAPLTEAQLQAVHVGQLTPLNGRIQFVEYDPAWPALFEREATRVRSILGARVLMLEHVGSTSVPGLAAKPRIDMLLIVANSADEAAYVADLEAAGYILQIREVDWYEHRLLKGPDTDINLHVFSQDCQEAARMLLFRDWLRSHPDERQLYERTKRELASREWKYVQNYADAKTAVVTEIMARALAGQQDKG
jgi:GrpB-like predicted nucleotidyltransferase (UPF0157 family)/ADP-ribose pyrophosphatase YjhB (NUDIX family)